MSLMDWGRVKKIVNLTFRVSHIAKKIRGGRVVVKIRSGLY
jgi:hypothetical protein